MSAETQVIIDIAADVATIAALPLMVLLSAEGRRFVRYTLNAIRTMSHIEDVLSRVNLKLDDLNAAERETLFRWQREVAAKTITVEGIKQHLRDLITAVERDLAGIEEPKYFWSRWHQKRKDVYLKARLKNYLMLYDFVTSPERAQNWIDQQVRAIAS